MAQFAKRWKINKRQKWNNWINQTKNKEFENKSVTSDDSFYLTETPTNIKNEILLKNWYFMDMLGLNEKGAS